LQQHALSTSFSKQHTFFPIDEPFFPAPFFPATDFLLPVFGVSSQQSAFGPSLYIRLGYFCSALSDEHRAMKVSARPVVLRKRILFFSDEPSFVFPSNELLLKQ